MVKELQSEATISSVGQDFQLKVAADQTWLQL